MTPCPCGYHADYPYTSPLACVACRTHAFTPRPPRRRHWRDTALETVGVLLLVVALWAAVG